MAAGQKYRDAYAAPNGTIVPTAGEVPDGACRAAAVAAVGPLWAPATADQVVGKR